MTDDSGMDACLGFPPRTVAPARVDAAGVERSTGKDLGHGMLVASGWVAILLLWGRVLRGTSPGMLLLAAGSVVLCGIISIAVTRLWIAHNVAIFRAKGPRRGVPTVEFEYREDWVGRRVTGDLEAARGAGIVVICASTSRKVFLSDPSSDAISAELEADRHALESGVTA